MALSYFCFYGLALFHHVSLVEFGVYPYPLVQGHCGLCESVLFCCIERLMTLLIYSFFGPLEYDPIAISLFMP